MDILELRPWPERALAALDQPRSRVGGFLAPFSALYRLGGFVHRMLRPRRALPSPPHSIAVGNLRVGGTGKTPVVAECVRLLRARGRTCAVLSRGYRAEAGGDEPDWLEREGGAPVIQDPDRRRGLELARRRGAEVVILDDGFQSRDQARVRLCIVLARDLVHPPRELPAGPARESPAALARAHALLVRREAGDPLPEPGMLPPDHRDLPLYSFRMCPNELVDCEGNTAGLEGVGDWGAGLLVSGLARPQSLEADALSTGASLAASLRFSDHARFRGAESAIIGRTLRESGAGWILSSEKNASRLEALDLGVPVWALRSRLEWDGEDPGAWLDEGLRGA